MILMKAVPGWRKTNQTRKRKTCKKLIKLINKKVQSLSIFEWTILRHFSWVSKLSKRKNNKGKFKRLKVERTLKPSMTISETMKKTMICMSRREKVLESKKIYRRKKSITFKSTEYHRRKRLLLKLRTKKNLFMRLEICLTIIKRTEKNKISSRTNIRRDWSLNKHLISIWEITNNKTKITISLSSSFLT